MGVGPLLDRCGGSSASWSRARRCLRRLPTAGALTPRVDPAGRGQAVGHAEHDRLPLPDYDHLPVQGLASRILTLDVAVVETLLEYERAHADRLQVVTTMENRLSALREGA